MYRAKAEGRNQSHFYSKKIHEEVKRRVELEQDLRNVVERNELVVHYQPQVSPLNQKLVGIEALVRWQHPEKGLISPLEFIPIAEDTGLIEDIGLWILGVACEQFSRWQKQYRSSEISLSIAINLSVIQLNNPDIFKGIKNILSANDLAASSIEIELTETAINQTEVAHISS
jgi:EAL domain-containing protein (putative c-di-GMP-specific phosphodiesterase class I)